MIDTLIGALLVASALGVQVLFAAFVLLRPQARQSSSMAWILVILVLPVLGILLYLVLGDVRFGRRRIQRYREVVDILRGEALVAWRDFEPVELLDTRLALASLARVAGETEPRPGNRVDLLAETGEVIDGIIRDVAHARDHCHLLFYIYLDDEAGSRVAQALMEACRRGVRCRLLVDAVGSSRFLKSALRREMEAAGIQVVPALATRFLAFPTMRLDLRNHRKIVIVDGSVGYTGSHNLASADFAVKPAFAPWVDATLRIEGPAVRDLQTFFVQDWFMDTGESLAQLLRIDVLPQPDGVPVQVVGTGANSRTEALVQLLQAAIHLAREELILTTPYFVPDEGTLDAMATAATRGVRTTLVLPARNDSRLVALASRSFYEPLLSAGVEIWEFRSGLLHAKTMTVDRDLAVVSTANFDRRSFEINLEVSTIVFDSDFASRLRLLQRTYMEESRAVDVDAWMRRAWPTRVAHNAAGLMAPLL